MQKDKNAVNDGGDTSDLNRKIFVFFRAFCLGRVRTYNSICIYTYVCREVACMWL